MAGGSFLYHCMGATLAGNMSLKNNTIAVNGDRCVINGGESPDQMRFGDGDNFFLNAMLSLKSQPGFFQAGFYLTDRTIYF